MAKNDIDNLSEEVRKGMREKAEQQHLAIQAELDRAYEDRLRGIISEELWLRKSAEWQDELELVRAEAARCDLASQNYAVTGSRILELARDAARLFDRQEPAEQARLVKTLISNCTFDRGTLSPTYTSPFDWFVKGNETGDGWEAGIRSLSRGAQHVAEPPRQALPSSR